MSQSQSQAFTPSPVLRAQEDPRAADPHIEAIVAKIRELAADMDCDVRQSHELVMDPEGSFISSHVDVVPKSGSRTPEQLNQALSAIFDNNPGHVAHDGRPCNAKHPSAAAFDLDRSAVLTITTTLTFAYAVQSDGLLYETQGLRVPAPTTETISDMGTVIFWRDQECYENAVAARARGNPDSI